MPRNVGGSGPSGVCLCVGDGTMTKAEAAKVVSEFERLRAMLERIEGKLDQSLKRLAAIERRLAGPAEESQALGAGEPPMVSKLVH